MLTSSCDMVIQLSGNIFAPNDMISIKLGKSLVLVEIRETNLLSDTFPRKNTSELLQEMKGIISLRGEHFRRIITLLIYIQICILSLIKFDCILTFPIG